jgi:hypothetical protein
LLDVRRGTAVISLDERERAREREKGGQSEEREQEVRKWKLKRAEERL